MPGIVGLLSKLPREEAERKLLQMLSTLLHEPSYESGTWIDESLGVYVGWVVRKGSFSDPMPLVNEKGDVTLVFCGEEFPEPGTARRLKQRGHALEEHGPSYLVHLYEDDPAFPSGLNGRFHGLTADRSRGTAMLFNDRYGMQRIYYHESPDAFYFAAEAKAILQVLPELRSPDFRGLGERVACGCAMENRTIFKGVQLLPPASAWLFRRGALVRKSAYFRPREWEEQPAMDSESYYRELREVFARNLPRYFEGQERIGMSLTGGLDTRMIMAWQKRRPGSLPCYSFGGMFRDCQDVVMARRVAHVCGQPHEVIPLGSEFLCRFPDYASRSVYLTDGCIGVDHSPDLYVNELAARIAPVRMTGNYGGEVLRSARAFRPTNPLPGLFRPEFMFWVSEAGRTYSELTNGNALSFTVFRQAPWYHYSLLSLEQSQISLRSPFLDNDLVRTVFRAPVSTLSNHDICLRLIADGDPALHRMRTDRGVTGNGNRLAGAMARGLLEFTFKAEYAYDYGMPQFVARIDHFFSPLHLERLFLGRHKFYHFRIWYREALSRYVRDILLDSKSLCRSYVQPEVLASIVRGHLRGDRNYTSAIHQALTLELVHRRFFDAG